MESVHFHLPSIPRLWEGEDAPGRRDAQESIDFRDQPQSVQGVVRKNRGLATIVAMDMIEIGGDVSGSIDLLLYLHVHWEVTSVPMRLGEMQEPGLEPMASGQCSIRTAPLLCSEDGDVP